MAHSTLLIVLLSLTSAIVVALTIFITVSLIRCHINKTRKKPEMIGRKSEHPPKTEEIEKKAEMSLIEGETAMAPTDISRKSEKKLVEVLDEKKKKKPEFMAASHVSTDSVSFEEIAPSAKRTVNWGDWTHDYENATGKKLEELSWKNLRIVGRCYQEEGMTVKKRKAWKGSKEFRQPLNKKIDFEAFKETREECLRLPEPMVAEVEPPATVNEDSQQYLELDPPLGRTLVNQADVSVHYLTNTQIAMRICFRVQSSNQHYRCFPPSGILPPGGRVRLQFVRLIKPGDNARLREDSVHVEYMEVGTSAIHDRPDRPDMQFSKRPVMAILTLPFRFAPMSITPNMFFLAYGKNFEATIFNSGGNAYTFTFDTRNAPVKVDPDSGEVHPGHSETIKFMVGKKKNEKRDKKKKTKEKEDEEELGDMAIYFKFERVAGEGCGTIVLRFEKDASNWLTEIQNPHRANGKSSSARSSEKGKTMAVEATQNTCSSKKETTTKETGVTKTRTKDK